MTTSSIPPRLQRFPALRFRSRLWAASLLLGGMSMLGSPAKGAGCDPDLLCPGSPCVIAQSVSVEPFCDLDFSGKDVTVAANAQISSAGDLRIAARNLTILGVVRVAGFYAYTSGLDLSVERDLTIGPGTGLLDLRGSAAFATSYSGFTAGGRAVIGGSGIRALGSVAMMEITADSVEITAPVDVSGGRDSDGEALYIYSRGPIRVSSKLRINTLKNAFFEFRSSESDVTLLGPIEKRGEGGGYVNVEAAGNASLHGNVNISAKSDSLRPQLYVAAGGDVTLTGKVKARGRGAAVAAIDLNAGRALVVTGQIDARAGKTAHGPPHVSLGPACSVTLTKAKIRTDGRPDGVLSVYSAGPLVGPGALLAASSLAPVKLRCQCIDANGDQVCDGGCVVPPDLTGVRFKPTIPEILPIASPPWPWPVGCP